MDKCQTCKNCVFDEIWGEYKCKIYHRRIYNPDEYADCNYYEEDKNKEKPTEE